MTKKKINIKLKYSEIYKNHTKKYVTQKQGLFLHDKYTPVCLDDMFQFPVEIRQMNEWLKSYETDNNDNNTLKKSLIISGPTGSGKTHISHLLFKQYGYIIKEYNASDIRNKKLIENEVEKLIECNNHYTKIGIIMDEIDGMLSGDKGGINQLIKILGSRKKKGMRIPIICISNNSTDKKILELKKLCLDITLHKTEKFFLNFHANYILNNECISFEKDALQFIVNSSQNDYRILYNFLHFFHLKLKNTDNKLTMKLVNTNMFLFHDKNIDITVYEMISKIFSGNISIDACLKLYDTDKSLSPMMIHENYIRYIENNKYDDSIVLAKKIIDNIIIGDMIDKKMYNTQYWHLQTVHGSATCVLPGYYINKQNKGNIPKEDIVFTTTLGKYSLQCSNKKNLIQTLSIANDFKSVFSFSDIQNLSIILLHNLLDPDGNIDDGLELMKKYNINFSDLDKLIKTNKLNKKYKKMYTSKKKTQIKKIIEATGIDQRNSKPRNVLNYNSSGSSGFAAEKVK
jgi:replication factor C subunit 1